jgi:Putative motility protein
MDLVSMVSGLMAMKSANLQGQVATTVMKQNLDAQESAVQTLLGVPSQANLGAGVGGTVDRMA